MFFKLAGSFLHFQDHIFASMPPIFCVVTLSSLMVSQRFSCSLLLWGPRTRCFHLIKPSPSLIYEPICLFFRGIFLILDLFRFSRNILLIFTVFFSCYISATVLEISSQIFQSMLQEIFDNLIKHFYCKDKKVNVCQNCLSFQRNKSRFIDLLYFILESISFIFHSNI